MYTYTNDFGKALYVYILVVSIIYINIFHNEYTL